MAVISPVRGNIHAGISTITWSNIAPGDTCNPALIMGQAGAVSCIQVLGTFGGATITLQASNDGTNFAALKDQSGSSITFTSADIRDISTAAGYVLPAISGGAGSSITVIMTLRA